MNVAKQDDVVEWMEEQNDRTAVFGARLEAFHHVSAPGIFG